MSGDVVMEERNIFLCVQNSVVNLLGKHDLCTSAAHSREKGSHFLQ